MLYKNLPRNVGLRRLTLHKSATGPNVNYILLVECSHFLDNINQVNTTNIFHCTDRYFSILYVRLFAGCEPAAGAAGEDMRLHGDLPDSGEFLTPAPRAATPPPGPRPAPPTRPCPGMLTLLLGAKYSANNFSYETSFNILHLLTKVRPLDSARDAGRQKVRGRRIFLLSVRLLASR